MTTYTRAFTSRITTISTVYSTKPSPFASKSSPAGTSTLLHGLGKRCFHVGSGQFDPRRWADRSKGFWLFHKISFADTNKELETKLTAVDMVSSMLKYRGLALPDTHPNTVRAMRIVKEITDGLNSWSSGNEAVKEATSHLVGFKWKPLVLTNEEIRGDFDPVNCSMGGQILVPSGLLHLETDAEIATLIASSVGRCVAQHRAETIAMFTSVVLQQLVFYQFIPLGIGFLPSSIVFSVLVTVFPSYRRCRLEADYIGLLLTASAGYDPREAPNVYKKLGERFDKYFADKYFALPYYLYPRPSWKLRAEMLVRAHIMEEAVAIYNDVRGRDGSS